MRHGDAYHKALGELATLAIDARDRHAYRVIREAMYPIEPERERRAP